MNGADYLFVVIVGASLTVGVLRGLIREAISLLTWLVGLWVAWHYAYVLDPYLGGALGAPGLREWVARILLLVGMLLLGATVGAIVGYVLDRSASLKVTDRMLGLGFGLVRALVIIGIFVMVCRGLDLDGEAWWQRSQFMPWAERLADWLEHYAEPTVAPLLDEASRALGG